MRKFLLGCLLLPLASSLARADIFRASGASVTTCSGSQFLQGPSTCATPAGGGGGSSSLAVATGSASGFFTPTSSPTAVLLFDSRTSSGTLLSGSTYFFQLLPSSVTLQGNTFNGVSQLVQTTAAGATPAAVFPALTGDMTTSAGSLATTAAAAQTHITSITSALTLGSAGNTVSVSSNFVVVGGTFPQNGNIVLGVAGSPITLGSAGASVTISSNVITPWATGYQNGVLNLGVSGSAITVNPQIIHSSASALSETTPMNGVAAQDVFWGDSTAHWPKFTPNASGSNYAIAASSASGTQGHMAVYSSNGLSVIDGGVPAAGGSTVSMPVYTQGGTGSNTGLNASSTTDCAMFTLPFQIKSTTITIQASTPDSNTTDKYSFSIINSSGVVQSSTTAASFTSGNPVDVAWSEGAVTLSAGQYLYCMSGMNTVLKLFASTGGAIACAYDPTINVGTSNNGIPPATFTVPLINPLNANSNAFCGLMFAIR